MEKELFDLLKTISKTYHLHAPKDNQDFPFIIYNILDGLPNLTGDNTYFSKTYSIQIDYYSREANKSIASLIEGTLKAKYDLIREYPMTKDEDDIFRLGFLYEKTIILGGN